MWRRRVVVVVVVVVVAATGDGGSIDNGEMAATVVWWWRRGASVFLFLCFSEMFVVRRRRRTTKKINAIYLICNFFAMRRLDARQRPFALRATEGARQSLFTVQKGAVWPGFAVRFLLFVVRPKPGFFLPLGTARYTAVTAVTAGVR
jgi:hypothetical protein